MTMLGKLFASISIFIGSLFGGSGVPASVPISSTTNPVHASAVTQKAPVTTNSGTPHIISGTTYEPSNGALEKLIGNNNLPAGFLVPVVSSIPTGYYDFLTMPTTSTSTEGYSAQYNSNDNNDRFIVTSEIDTSTNNYDLLVSGAAKYETKVTDFTYLGMPGVVFEWNESGNHNMDLFYHDGTKWLRISTQDHSFSFIHFTANTLITILKTFERSKVNSVAASSTPIESPFSISPVVGASASSTMNRHGTLIGEIFEVQSGSPQFATIELPQLQQNQSSYQIYLWNGNSYQFYQNVAPTVKFTFPNGGVSRFEIKIDPSLNACMGEFPIFISYNASGYVKETVQRLTTSESNPVCGS